MSIYTDMTDLELAVTKTSCVRALAPDQSKPTMEAAQRVLAKVIAEEKRRKHGGYMSSECFCANCGQPFQPDPLVAALNSVIGEGVPMERHGEMGMLRPGPLLCDACTRLPAKQLAEVINGLMRKQ